MVPDKMPDWFRKLSSAASSGETTFFVIHGDVDGYVRRYQSPRKYLRGVLARPEDPAADPTPQIVAMYDIARGITFMDDDAPAGIAPNGRPIPSMRQRATDALSVDDAPAAPAAAGFAAALGNLGPQQQQEDPFAPVQKVPALKALDRLMRAPSLKGKVRLVLDEADKIVPAGDVSTMAPEDKIVLVLLKTWARELAQTDNLCCLIVTELAGLHGELRAASSGWRAVEIAMPDAEARLGWVQFYLEDNEEWARLNGVDAAGMARLTAGLSLRNIEDIFLASGQDGVTPQLIMERKADIIRTEYSEVATIIEPLPGGLADIGGNDLAKNWIMRAVVNPIRQGRPEKAKRGLLMAGPPGTGKTMFVAGLAKDADMNCVSLDTAKIQDSLVGESEKRLAKFLGFAKTLAPTIIFVDEIDQSDLGNRGESSGNPVAKNLFGMMLQFMSDPSNVGKVVVIFATNQPDKLDPALIRPGRIDKVIPILLPERADRCEIAKKAAKFIGYALEDAAAEVIADGSDGYSGADIMALIGLAGEDMEIDGLTRITPELAAQALRYYRPKSLTTAQAYTRAAIAACDDPRLLPERYREMLLNPTAPAAQAAESAPVWEQEESSRRGRRS